MDAQEKLFRKQTNIYRMHELVDAIVTGVSNGARFDFSEAMIKRLHSVAMDGLLATAGEYRSIEVQILNSPHLPPSWIEVQTHMAGLIAYITANWDKRDLVHLAAFTMWRLNWIHPFANGNGRTARACAYLVMCAKNGRLFPPKNSVIEQIQREKKPYYELHVEADRRYEQTKDISTATQPLEALLSALLANQIKANL